MSEDNPTLYSESFKIRASEVNESGKATLPAICSLFQEVAGNHALKLKFDITDLHKHDLTWVLHRMDIKIDRYPDWRETITIKTWPAAGDALRAYRDYLILGEDGEEIGYCLSYWMMINLKTRRPVRMPREILKLKLADRDHVLNIKSERHMPFEDVEKSTTFTVRHSDLDMNQHVNNARYLEWIMESLPEDSQSEIERVDIIFVAESTFGDEIHAEVQQHKEDTGEHLIQLKNNKGRLAAIAELKY